MQVSAYWSRYCVKPPNILLHSCSRNNILPFGLVYKPYSFFEEKIQIRQSNKYLEVFTTTSKISLYIDMSDMSTAMIQKQAAVFSLNFLHLSFSLAKHIFRVFQSYLPNNSISYLVVGAILLRS